MSDGNNTPAKAKTMVKRKSLVWRIQRGMTSDGPFAVYYFIGGTSVKIHSAA